MVDIVSGVGKDTTRWDFFDTSLSSPEIAKKKRNRGFREHSTKLNLEGRRPREHSG